MIVGDQDGIVQLFSMRKDELIVHFKTLPLEKVQSIQLSGTPGKLKYSHVRNSNIKTFIKYNFQDQFLIRYLLLRITK